LLLDESLQQSLMLHDGGLGFIFTLNPRWHLRFRFINLFLTEERTLLNRIGYQVGSYASCGTWACSFFFLSLISWFSCVSAWKNGRPPRKYRTSSCPNVLLIHLLLPLTTFLISIGPRRLFIRERSVIGRASPRCLRLVHLQIQLIHGDIELPLVLHLVLPGRHLQHLLHMPEPSAVIIIFQVSWLSSFVVSLWTGHVNADCGALLGYLFVLEFWF